MVELKSGESLEYLVDDLFVLQSENEYRFTSDAILLANYVQAGRKSEVADLCSGSGVVGILAAYKNEVKSMTLVELQPVLADMSRRSVEMNGLNNVSVVNEDVRKVAEKIGRERFDAVCCNPPYYRVGEGKTSEYANIALCRHEIELTLKELVEAAASLIKFGGRFYVVYRADRLAELIYELTLNKLEPKEIVNKLPSPDKEVDTVLITAKRGAEKGVRVRSLLRSDVEKDYSILKRK